MIGPPPGALAGTPTGAGTAPAGAGAADKVTSADAGNSQILPHEPRLDRLAGQLGRNGLEPAEDPRDRNQLGKNLLTEDTRTELAVRARHRPSAQRAIDMQTTVGHHLGAGADRRHHDQIAIAP